MGSLRDCRLWLAPTLYSPRLNQARALLPPSPEQSGPCGLDYKSSHHSGSLDLPTSVQNKVLSLLMIKMIPVPCPSAMGLTRSVGSRPPQPLG